MKKRFVNAYTLANHDFIATKWCLPMWIHGWLEKIQWNIMKIAKIKDKTKSNNWY